MALYDSSVLIEYLDGIDAVVTHVQAHADERGVTVPLAVFEVYWNEF